jgi:FkbM family methyltransferase
MNRPLAKLAQFANDSYHIMRTPHSLSTKAGLWLDLLYPSNRVRGFSVSYLDRASYRLLYREIFARQYYFFRAQTDSPMIYDCGANIGMATLFFNWLYPKARIHSFEPDPTTFKVLQRNIAQNGLSATAHNCALWSENTEIPFFVHPSVVGSLRMGTDASRLDAATEIRVPSRKLSSFIEEPIDLLKIDVEGAEHHVICDLVSSRKIALIRQMLIEYHHAPEEPTLGQFLSTLESSGFEYQVQATPNDSQQDILIAAHQPSAALSN